MSTKKDILIIDDSNTNVVLLESLLKRNGYRVISARDGREGIERLDNNIPDLIFLDLKMPGLNGFEFIQALKSKKEWESIPIIILTAVSDKESMQRINDLGIEYYLSKPLDFDKIISLARQVLDD